MMSYKILPLPPFVKQLKRLIKKYPSLKEEYLELVGILENDPTNGIQIAENCYKIRLAIASKGKGKSGGARVITTFVIAQSTVYLLSIYDEKENLTDKELLELLKLVE